MEYFEEFDLVDYDPNFWAKTVKEARMKYAVLCTK
jgi:alpha-L-fucosidase